MKGSRPQALPPASAEGSGGRICAHAGCATRLSVYNVRDVCWQHTDLSFPNHRGKRLRDRRDA
jgi:hypothetical protein